MKLDLINNMNDRNEVMKKENQNKLLDILKKFGTVVDYMTETMVAEFYGVNDRTINHIGTRNQEELGKYGYRSYKKSEIEKIQLGFLENIPNRGLRLYPIQAVIVIGMMLTESKVAEQLRSEIVKEIFNENKEDTDILKGLALLKVAEGKTVEERISGATEYTRIVTRALEEENKKLEGTITDILDTNISYETLRKELVANVQTVAKVLYNNNYKLAWSEFYRFLRENGYNFELRRTNTKNKLWKEMELLNVQIEELTDNDIYEIEKEMKQYGRLDKRYRELNKELKELQKQEKEMKSQYKKMYTEFNRCDKCTKLDFVKEEEYKDIIIITRSWTNANGVDWREGLTLKDNEICLPF